jgi:hypothetical protein
VSTRFRLGSIALSALVLGASMGSCSSSSSDSSSPVNSDPVAPVLDVDCVDPAGDVSVGSIDVTTASVHPDGDILELRFDTLADIEGANDPIFSVSHGDPATNAGSAFELRTEKNISGAFGLQLITFPTQAQGQEVRKTVTSATVSVSGTSVVVRVPMSDLPKITTRVWLFGASAGGDEGRTADVCDTFGVESPDGSTPDGAGPASTTPPTTVKTGVVGEELPSANGGKVTLHGFENPAVPARTLEAPIPEGKVVVAADVEMCSGTKDVSGVGLLSWQLKTADNRLWSPWLDDHTADPVLPNSQRLPAGQCTRGWANWLIDAGSPPAQLTFDLAGSGYGPFLNWTLG